MDGDDTVENEIEKSRAYRALRKIREYNVPFMRAEAFHRKLMEEQSFWDSVRFDSGEFSTKTINTDDIRSKVDYINVHESNPQAIVNLCSYAYISAKNKKKKKRVNKDYRSKRFLIKISTWPPLNIFSRWLLRSRSFSTLMICVIVFNSILVAVDQEIDQSQKSTEMQTGLESLDFFFLIMFVTEIVLKWCDNFNHFWTDGWNIFDCLITMVSLVAPVLDVLYPDKDEAKGLDGVLTAVRYLRIIRILRSLNVVTRIHKIELIWRAVLKTFSSLFFITALMFIFFYIFAIIGIQLFDRYTHSHNNFLKYRRAFADLANCFVTLFQLFTLDHWYDLLQEMSHIIGWGIPTCYIILWVLIGSFIFRNIFVGVMVNNFQLIRSELLEKTQSLQKARNLARNKRINIFALDSIENEVAKQEENPDPILDWESGVFHNIEVIKAIKNMHAPTMWPRDTLFGYYVILEALASNTDEKHRLLHLLDDSIAKFNDE